MDLVGLLKTVRSVGPFACLLGYATPMQSPDVGAEQVSGRQAAGWLTRRYVLLTIRHNVRNENRKRGTSVRIHACVCVRARTRRTKQKQFNPEAEVYLRRAWI